MDTSHNHHGLLYDRSYYENFYMSHIARNLVKVGYQIERNGRNFEIVGIDRELVEKYSTRMKQVEAEARKRGLSSNHLKAELGGKTRARKEETVDSEENQRSLEARATEAEKRIIFSRKGSTNDEDDSRSLSPEEAVDYALRFHLSRKSAITEKQLLEAAIKRTHGEVVPSQIQSAYEKRKDIIKATDNRTKAATITTQFALDEEDQLKLAARQGRGVLEPINPDYRIQNPRMNDEQANAAHHILKSRDRITVVSGGAGVGKTWSIKEAAAGAEEAGIKFHAFAPSSKASREVQREEGFKDATTVASLIDRADLQRKPRGGVIWIDEAGQLGNEDMNQVIKIAEAHGARVLLTGDTRQHNAVARGDALRVIEEFGGIEPARISKIQRQKIHGNEKGFKKEDRERVDRYRSAVKAISEGDIEKGYNTLNEMGAIIETCILYTSDAADE